jgi:mRNA interferase RelE/StbE
VVRYELRIKPSAVKELEEIPEKQKRQLIVKRIQGFAHDPYPHGCKKLSGMDKYRIRVGHYRILYAIENEKHVIHIIKIAHRKDVYR